MGILIFGVRIAEWVFECICILVTKSKIDFKRLVSVLAIWCVEYLF
jgi:hypothetical protein